MGNLPSAKKLFGLGQDLKDATTQEPSCSRFALSRVLNRRPKRVLVIGEQSSGKSTVINMLLNCSAFSCYMNAPACTNVKQKHPLFATYFHPDPTINECYTETPGVSNLTLIRGHAVSAVLSQFTQYCSQGFDCILLVRRGIGPLSSLERKNIQLLGAMFGDCWEGSAVLLCTHAVADMTRQQWQEMHQSSADPALKRLLALRSVLFVEHGLDPQQEEVEMHRYFERVKGQARLREALDEAHGPVHARCPAEWQTWLLGVATLAFAAADGPGSPFKPVPMETLVAEVQRMVEQPKSKWKRKFGTCLVCSHKVRALRYEGVGLAPCCSQVFHDQCLAAQSKCPNCRKALPRPKPGTKPLSPPTSDPRSLTLCESPFLDASLDSSLTSTSFSSPSTHDASLVTSPGKRSLQFSPAVVPSGLATNTATDQARSRRHRRQTQTRSQKRQRRCTLPAVCEGREREEGDDENLGSAGALQQKSRRRPRVHSALKGCKELQQQILDHRSFGTAVKQGVLQAIPNPRLNAAVLLQPIPMERLEKLSLQEGPQSADSDHSVDSSLVFASSFRLSDSATKGKPQNARYTAPEPSPSRLHLAHFSHSSSVCSAQASPRLNASACNASTFLNTTAFLNNFPSPSGSTVDNSAALDSTALLSAFSSPSIDRSALTSASALWTASKATPPSRNFGDLQANSSTQFGSLSPVSPLSSSVCMNSSVEHVYHHGQTKWVASSNESNDEIENLP